MAERDGQRPVLLVVAGPNGSGKTELATNILAHDWAEGCEYINPDNIARGRFGDWNQPDAVRDAAQYATQLRYQLLAEGRSIAFETVDIKRKQVPEGPGLSATGHHASLTERPVYDAGMQDC